MSLERLDSRCRHVSSAERNRGVGRAERDDEHGADGDHNRKPTPTTVAVPAVFLYRLLMFWVPILPGWLAFQWL
jgi:hypothetical protein